MFSKALELLSYNLLALGVIFVIVLIATAFIFSGRNGSFFLLGLLRLIASIFFSPFVYLKRAIHGIAGLGHEGDRELALSRQYLLTKLMYTLQAILIIAAVAIVAVGLYRTWYAFIPPQHVREAVSRLNEDIREKSHELETLDASLSDMDSLWTNHRDSLISNYDKVREANTRKFADSLQAVAAKIGELQDEYANNFFGRLRTSFAYYEQSTQRWQINNARDDVNRFIRRQNLVDSVRTLFYSYSAIWHSWMITKSATITGLNEIDTRAIIQPMLASSQSRASELKTELDARRNELTQWKQQEKFNPMGAMWEILKMVLALILQIWTLGLIIEALWLAIHVAANVQRIRDFADDPARRSPTIT